MRKKIASYIAPQASENGSVCLAMLASYYGKRVPLIRAAQLCGVTQDGCSLEQIAGGAGEMGFETELQATDPEALRSRQEPCIVTVNGAYAVFAGFRGNRVRLCTPDRGRIRMPASEFAAACGDRALSLSPPRDGFPENARRSSSLTYAISLILGKKAGYAVFYVTLISAISMLLLFLPKIISDVTDAYFSGTVELSAHQKDVYFITVVLCLLLLLVLEICTITAFSRFSADVSTRCRRRMIWASMNLPLGHYQTRSDGYFMESVRQSLNLGYFLSKQVVEVVLRPVLAVILLFAMARVSILCTLVVAASVVIMIAASLLSARFENERGRIVFSDAAKENGFLLEGLKSIRSIRNAGAEFVFFRSFVKISRSAMLTARQYVSAQRVFGILPGSISNMTKLALILVGIVSIYSGELSLGSLIFLHGTFCIVQQYLQAAIFSGKVILSMGYQLDN